MHAQSVAVTAIALSLVVAGCAAPTHDGRTPTHDDADITVEGGTLPVDPEVVFQRVTSLLGADVAPPDKIRVLTREDVNASAGRGGLSGPPSFFRLLDVDTDAGEGLNATERARLVNGATGLGVGTVTLYLGANDSETVEMIFAHEFVHYVKVARDRPIQLQRVLPATTDGSFVARSLLEGVAVYTTDRYVAEYLPGGSPNSALYDEVAVRIAPGSLAWYGNARYQLGWRYVASRVTSPTETDAVYGSPPRTSEQLIHRLDPDEEPPRPMSVSTTLGEYRHVTSDRLGEAFLRVALQNGVSRDRAARAAAGWGNDTLRTYRRIGARHPGYAWVLRFDDAANRSAFLPAMEATLDARGPRINGTWRAGDSWARFDLQTVGADTVVLLTGTQHFLDDTNVTWSEATVQLTLAGE